MARSPTRGDTDPLVTLRALVMEGHPLRVRWRLTPGGIRTREATGNLAWEGIDLVLVDTTGVRWPIPLGSLIAVRAADTGRLLWSS